MTSYLPPLKGSTLPSCGIDSIKQPLSLTDHVLRRWSWGGTGTGNAVSPTGLLGMCTWGMPMWGVAMIHKQINYGRKGTP